MTDFRRKKQIANLIEKNTHCLQLAWPLARLTLAVTVHRPSAQRRRKHR
jgi:hypothetical protein